jgi:hypothetical protein
MNEWPLATRRPEADEDAIRVHYLALMSDYEFAHLRAAMTEVSSERKQKSDHWPMLMASSIERSPASSLLRKSCCESPLHDASLASVKIQASLSKPLLAGVHHRYVRT